MLRSDLRLELEGAQNLREAIAYADSVHDYVSRDMMIEILADEEGHIDWLETELDLIGKIGLQITCSRRSKCQTSQRLPPAPKPAAARNGPNGSGLLLLHLLLPPQLAYKPAPAHAMPASSEATRTNCGSNRQPCQAPRAARYFISP